MSKSNSQVADAGECVEDSSGNKSTRPANMEFFLPDICASMEDAFVALKRGIAGFTTLSAALRTVTGTTHPNERKRGLPILEFPASLVGSESRDTLRCAVDLQSLSVEHAQHVLIPMVLHQHGAMLQTLNALQNDIEKIRPVIMALISPTQTA